MSATISQLFYPNWRTFFERLALTLLQQPAIKIGPAPLPAGTRRFGSQMLRKAVPTETLSTAQRSMKARRNQGIQGRQDERNISI
jgi:hypothetical protein